jgi:hypothetical protein
MNFVTLNNIVHVMIKGYIRTKDISLPIQMQHVTYTNISLKLMELDEFINIDAFAYAVQLS